MLSRSDDHLLRDSYNAHERAEVVMQDALYAHLRTLDVETLATLVDPEWNWKTRSWLSEHILEHASEVLDEKLEAAVA